MSERGRINIRNQRFRRRLLAISDRCAYCGWILRFNTSSIDHVRSRYWGGSDEPENLVLACRRCNRIKGDEAVEDLACPVRRGARLRFVWEISFHEREPMKVAFNYEMLLDTQRTLARDGATKIRDLVRLSSAAIVDIGKILAEVHAVLRDEHYQAWLKAEFGWTHNAAWHYESAAKKFGDVGESIERIQPGALRILSNGNVNPKAVKESLDRAGRGEIVTRQAAEKIIRKHLRPGDSSTALRRPIYEFRRAIKSLLSLPLEERRKLADELIALATQLRQGDPDATPSITTATAGKGRGKTARLEVGQETDGDTETGADPGPGRQAAPRRRRALAIA